MAACHALKTYANKIYVINLGDKSRRENTYVMEHKGYTPSPSLAWRLVPALYKMLSSWRLCPTRQIYNRRVFKSSVRGTLQNRKASVARKLDSIIKTILVKMCFDAAACTITVDIIEDVNVKGERQTLSLVGVRGTRASAGEQPTATAGDIYVYLRVTASSQALLRHPLT